MAELEFISGPIAGRSVEVEGELVLGRVDGDLLIADEEVSGRHAQLRLTDDGAIEVTDLESSNGTWVDGGADLGADPTGRRGAAQGRLQRGAGDCPRALGGDPGRAARRDARRRLSTTARARRSCRPAPAPRPRLRSLHPVFAAPASRAGSPRPACGGRRSSPTRRSCSSRRRWSSISPPGRRSPRARRGQPPRAAPCGPRHAP